MSYRWLHMDTQDIIDEAQMKLDDSCHYEYSDRQRELFALQSIALSLIAIVRKN